VWSVYVDAFEQGELFADDCCFGSEYVSVLAVPVDKQYLLYVFLESICEPDLRGVCLYVNNAFIRRSTTNYTLDSV
jgi:hypothetical protein